MSNCKMCGQSFTRNTNMQVYCSVDCRLRFYDPDYRKIVKRNCLFCNKSFAAFKKRKKMFCSDKCRSKHFSKKVLTEMKDERKQIFDIYGASCNCCGESNKTFLTLDHINGDGKKHREQTSRVYRDAIKEKDKLKYQILCYNCNIGKYRNGGICPHKSISTL